MLITLDQAFLDKYPEAEIGFLVAQVSVKKRASFVEGLKSHLSQHLKEKGIEATNFVAHPSVAIWRTIYQKDFEIKPKSYRSSIESLLRRVVTGKEIWNINTVVDLYNCCSILSLLPMGGYDLDKVSGNITIRYAREGEMFRGLGEKKALPIKQNHLVYADDQKVMCWLWNHKDAAETCIDTDTKRVLFFVDSVGSNQVALSLKLLARYLEEIQCVPIQLGVLNQSDPKGKLC